MDGKRLCLDSPERIGLGTPISVEYNDAMFLGEVSLCKARGDGNFQVEVYVEQILTGLQSLIALRAGLLGDAEAVKQRAFAPVRVQNRTQERT